MKKLIFVFFGVFLVWSCESSKEDKVRLAVLKSVYDEKWGICNRAVYAHEKTIVENGSKEAEMKVLNESLHYRDSTLHCLEKGKITLARALVAKGLLDKKLNAEKLVAQMDQLDCAYVAHKDSTSLLYVEISIVSGLSQILRNNSARLSSSF